MKVVIDIDIPQLSNNRLFNRQEAFKVSHTILPMCFLYDEALKQGIEFVTPDVYLSLSNKPINTLMISHLQTSYTEKLISAGAIPTILTCQESPFIATRFFLNLKKVSQKYKYSVVFSGMKNRLSIKTKYLQMYFPSTFDLNEFEINKFTDKNLLTMISGNKRIGSWKKNILLKLFYGFKVKEIYDKRLKVISFFSKKKCFDLYGGGWDKGAGDVEIDKDILSVYKGRIPDKTEVLRQYKFAFCFENSIFPGYVTEKIFDVMFAGCVPIYCGAPDIKDCVPENCFIDIRDYDNYESLYNFINSMTESKYNEYIENIRSYLGSKQFYKFTQEYFAKQILNILENEFKRYE